MIEGKEISKNEIVEQSCVNANNFCEHKKIPQHSNDKASQEIARYLETKPVNNKETFLKYQNRTPLIEDQVLNNLVSKPFNNETVFTCDNLEELCVPEFKEVKRNELETKTSNEQPPFTYKDPTQLGVTDCQNLTIDIVKSKPHSNRKSISNYDNPEHLSVAEYEEIMKKFLKNEPVNVETPHSNLDNQDKLSVEEFLEVMKTPWKSEQLNDEKTFFMYDNSEQFNVSECLEVIKKHVPSKLFNKKQTCFIRETSKLSKQCTICGYIATQRSHLTSHMITHKAPEEIHFFSCSICSFKSKYEKSIKRHLIVHANPENVTMYKCNKCHFKSKHKNSLKCHLLLHKVPDEEVFLGNTYGLSAIQDCSLSSEPDQHHNAVYAENFENCQDQISNDNTKLVYINCINGKTKHLTMKEQDPVLSVEYNLESQSSEINHKNLKELTRFNCSKCKYRTRHKGDFKRHNLLHDRPDELKIFGCDTCGYRARQKSHLTSHMLIHKDPAEIVLFTCDLCKFETKYERSLRRHMIVHKYPKTSIYDFQYTNADITRFMCTICGYKAGQKSHLASHLLTHKSPEETEWFSCKTCEFKTKYERSMKRHLTIHRNSESAKSEPKKLLQACLLLNKMPELCTTEKKSVENLENNRSIKREVIQEETLLSPSSTQDPINDTSDVK